MQESNDSGDPARSLVQHCIAGTTSGLMDKLMVILQAKQVLRASCKYNVRLGKVGDSVSFFQHPFVAIRETGSWQPEV